MRAPRRTAPASRSGSAPERGPPRQVRFSCLRFWAPFPCFPFVLPVPRALLPPLASRPADILPLAAGFLAPGKSLHPAAQAALMAHPWPGNVRELKNVMQRASLLAQGSTIKAEDLGLPLAALPAVENEPDRDTIAQSLARANGVVAQAAAELGLSRQALYRRMERLGIARP